MDDRSEYQKYHEDVYDALLNFTGMVLTPIGRNRFPDMLVQAAEEAQALLKREVPEPNPIDLRLTVGELNILSDLQLFTIKDMMEFIMGTTR